ncbi:MAG: sodium:calcium antiporter, partial [Alphaproteobacteria bacterium]|nr:sodium:calcium antiporter [Alphaproteobacteria bacterium]
MSEALIPLILGFVALGVAGEALLRGAVTVASALRVPPLIIGLTIIAFGTSAPELTVSIDAALLGQPDISLGNVIGSNIANILLVLGMMAAVRPFTVDNSTLARDGAVMLAVSVLLVVLGYIGLISRVLGGVLLVMLVAYTVWLYRASRSQLDSDETDAEVAENNLPGGLPVGVPVLLLGLVGIVWGADKMVTGAILMAQHFGISEAIIGLSIVAIGTSLPELAVSLVASLRGHAGLAVGNIIGSNIFNT